jgi:hypothetical protein
VTERLRMKTVSTIETVSIFQFRLSPGSSPVLMRIDPSHNLLALNDKIRFNFFRAFRRYVEN